MHVFMDLQVVRELQHSRDGVTVITEDGYVYEANYVILSVSIGVLQSHLISFNPNLPVRFSLNQSLITFYFYNKTKLKNKVAHRKQHFG